MEERSRSFAVGSSLARGRGRGGCVRLPTAASSSDSEICTSSLSGICPTLMRHRSSASSRPAATANTTPDA